MKRSQGIKLLSCAMLVCCIPSSLTSGNISALSASQQANHSGGPQVHV